YTTISPDEAIRIGYQAAAALTAAHAAGIVHRDVKPANILLADDGTVKITDFGISRAVGDVTLTRTGMLAGTPAYLAPEAARGDVPTAASDVFSLGATLYAAVEGAPPFGRDDNPLALLHAVSAGRIDPPRRAGVLTGLLMDLLRVDPAQRPTMIQVKVALAALAQDSSREVPPSGYLDPTLVAQEKIGLNTFASLENDLSFPKWPSDQPHVESARRGSSRRSAIFIGIAAALAVVGGAVAINAMSAEPAATGKGDITREAPPTSPPTPHPIEPAPSRVTKTPVSPNDVISNAEDLLLPLKPFLPALPFGQGNHSNNTDSGDSGGASTNPEIRVSPEKIKNAVKDYYYLLPREVDQAWQHLTPKLQQQGYKNYRSAWSLVHEIQIIALEVDAASGFARATLMFSLNDGTTKIEEHQLSTAVSENGRILINSDQYI
ncbi:MAG: serine/threonine-protein kinase, partial [Pyrinomonadaceae bacterium]